MNSKIIDLLILIGLNFLLIQCGPISIPSSYACNSVISNNWQNFALQSDPFCLLSMDKSQIYELLSNSVGRSSEIFKNKLDIVFSRVANYNPTSIYNVICPTFILEFIDYLYPPVNFPLLVYQWLIQVFLPSPRLYFHPNVRPVFADIINHISNSLKVDYFRKLSLDDQTNLIFMINSIIDGRFYSSVRWTINQSAMILDISVNTYRDRKLDPLKIPIITVDEFINIPSMVLFKQLYDMDFNLKYKLFDEKECDIYCRGKFLHLLKKSSLDICGELPFENSYNGHLNDLAQLVPGPYSTFILTVAGIEVSNLTYCNIYASQSANGTLQFTVYPHVGYFPHVTVDTQGLFDTKKEIPDDGILRAIFNEVKTRQIVGFPEFMEGTTHPPLFLSRTIEKRRGVIFLRRDDIKSIKACVSLKEVLRNDKNENENENPIDFETDDLVKTLFSDFSDPSKARPVSLTVYSKEKLNSIFNNTEWKVMVQYSTIINLHEMKEVATVLLYANGSELYRGDGHDIRFPPPTETTVLVDQFLRYPSKYREVIDSLGQIKAKRNESNLDHLFPIPDLVADLQKCMCQERCRSDFIDRAPDIVVSYQPPNEMYQTEAEILWNGYTIFRSSLYRDYQTYINVTKYLFDTGKGYTIMQNLFLPKRLEVAVESTIFGYIRQVDVDEMVRRGAELSPKDIHSNILRFGSIARYLILTDYDSSDGKILFHMDHLTINCQLSELISALESSTQFNRPDAFYLSSCDFKAVLPIFFNMHLQRIDLYARVTLKFLEKLINACGIYNDWIALFNVLSRKSIILGSSIPLGEIPPYRGYVIYKFKSLGSAVLDKITNSTLPLSYESFTSQPMDKKAEMIYISLMEGDVEFLEKMTLNDLLDLLQSEETDAFLDERAKNELLNASLKLKVKMSALVNDPDQKITMDNLIKSFNDSSTISALKKEVALKLITNLLRENER